MTETFKRKYYGRVEKYKLTLYKRREFIEAIKTLEGEEVEITISKKEGKCSTRINKYYWKVLISIVTNETGNDPDMVHRGFIKKYLRQIIRCDDATGERKLLSSIAELTESEMITYINLIITGEPEYNIPYPGDAEYD